MSRTNIRHRAVDLSKPLQIITDINELYKKDENSALNWGKELSGDTKSETKSIKEAEIKKIIELYDKKRTIIIPKVEEKTPSGQPSQSSEGKFSTHTVAYKQTEYVRPKNYIVYSEKNRLEPQGKDYEATTVDMNFLNFEKFFISVEELEKIISALENDINKGEMIPTERVKEIIQSIIPDKKQHIDKIIRYWHTRREDFKKSLLRKFWKDQKYTDKYLGTTFRRREREKMKTRRNKKNEIEGLQKLKEIRESTQKYLINIVNMMKEREMTKRNLLILQQLEFEEEVNKFRGTEKVNVEEKYREFIKNLPKLVKPAPIPSPIKQSDKLKDVNNLPSSILSADVNIMNNIAGEKTDSSLHVISEPKKPKSSTRIRPRPSSTKQIVIPSTQQQVTHVTKPEQAIVEKPKPQTELSLKHRIRFNRSGKLSIDRYIQAPNSFSPFDDDFDFIMNKPKIYSEDFVQHNKKNLNFDNFYENYLKGKYSGVMFTDSEDEPTNFNSQVRSFSSSYKQFLKQKRAHSEVSI